MSILATLKGSTSNLKFNGIVEKINIKQDVTSSQSAAAFQILAKSFREEHTYTDGEVETFFREAEPRFVLKDKNGKIACRLHTLITGWEDYGIYGLQSQKILDNSKIWLNKDLTAFNQPTFAEEAYQLVFVVGPYFGNTTSGIFYNNFNKWKAIVMAPDLFSTFSFESYLPTMNMKAVLSIGLQGQTAIDLEGDGNGSILATVNGTIVES